MRVATNTDLFRRREVSLFGVCDGWEGLPMHDLGQDGTSGLAYLWGIGLLGSGVGGRRVER